MISTLSVEEIRALLSLRGTYVDEWGLHQPGCNTALRIVISSEGNSVFASIEPVSPSSKKLPKTEQLNTLLWAYSLGDDSAKAIGSVSLFDLEYHVVWADDWKILMSGKLYDIQGEIPPTPKPVEIRASSPYTVHPLLRPTLENIYQRVKNEGKN